MNSFKTLKDQKKNFKMMRRDIKKRQSYEIYKRTSKTTQ